MFAPTHTAFGLGDASRAGVGTSFGLGARPATVPEKDRPLSADYTHLFIDLRMKQFYKETKEAIADRQVAYGNLLDGSDSELTRADVGIRQAEDALRHLLIQRRLNP